jgi:hypothetical protein
MKTKFLMMMHSKKPFNYIYLSSMARKMARISVWNQDQASIANAIAR